MAKMMLMSEEEVMDLCILDEMDPDTVSPIRLDIGNH